LVPGPAFHGRDELAPRAGELVGVDAEDLDSQLLEAVCAIDGGSQRYLPIPGQDSHADSTPCQNASTLQITTRGGGMNRLVRFVASVSILAVAACAQPPAAPTAPPDTRAADEATILAAVEEWSAAAQAKDADEFVSFYADDAVLMLEDAPDLAGAESIREGVSAMMQDPAFDLSFQAEDVVVARAGDLAYETGSYSLTLSDAAQNPVTDTGRYVVVWEKQADGAWKVVLDVPVSEPAGPIAME